MLDDRLFAAVELMRFSKQVLRSLRKTIMAEKHAIIMGPTMEGYKELGFWHEIVSILLGERETWQDGWGYVYKDETEQTIYEMVRGVTSLRMMQHK